MSDYNREAIITQIAAGLSEGQTLRAMCREEDMPGYVTIYNWIKENSDFAERIACAREAGYDCIADQIIEIIDETSDDYVTDKDGNERPNNEIVARSRLRAEMRLKLLAKWSPKKYGEKTETAITGADGGAIKIESLSDTEIARQIYMALAIGASKIPDEVGNGEVKTE